MAKWTLQELFSNFSNFSKITKSSTQDVPIDYELFLLSFKIQLSPNSRSILNTGELPPKCFQPKSQIRPYIHIADENCQKKVFTQDPKSTPGHAKHDNQTGLSIISGSKTRWRIGDFCIRVLFSESEMSKQTFQKLFSNFSNFSKITKSSAQDVPIDYELFLLSFKIQLSPNSRSILNTGELPPKCFQPKSQIRPYIHIADENCQKKVFTQDPKSTPGHAKHQREWFQTTFQ